MMFFNFSFSICFIQLIKSCQSSPILAKRSDDYIQLPLTYQDQTLLFMPLQIGTPPQNIMVALDTGSSDLLASLPSVPEYFAGSGSYSPNGSTTFENLSITYDMQYQSGDAGGYMGTENFSFGGKSVNDLQFAVISDNPLGINNILGLTSVLTENIYIDKYPNFMVEAVSQGIIPRGIVSIYSGTHSAEEGGSIVFGGVDLAKFDGNLVEIDCVPQVDYSSTTRAYWVKVNSFTFGNQEIKLDLLQGSTNATADLDTGNSVLGASAEVCQCIGENYFNVSDVTTDHVSCDYLNSDDVVTIGLDGIDVEIPVSQFIFADGSGECILGLNPESYYDTNFYFGLSILQYLYAAFDPINLKVYVAQGFPTNDSNPVAVYDSTDITGLIGQGSSPFFAEDTSPTSSSTPLFSNTSSTYASTSLSTSSSLRSTSTITSFAPSETSLSKDYQLIRSADNHEVPSGNDNGNGFGANNGANNDGGFGGCHL